MGIMVVYERSCEAIPPKKSRRKRRGGEKDYSLFLVNGALPPFLVKILNKVIYMAMLFFISADFILLGI